MLTLTHQLPANPHEFEIVVNTGNAASQQVLEAERGRNVVLCACVRQIWLLSTVNNFALTNNKPGASFILANVLSRRSSSEIHHRAAALGCQERKLIELFPTLTLDILKFNLY